MVTIEQDDDDMSDEDDALPADPLLCGSLASVGMDGYVVYCTGLGKPAGFPTGTGLGPGPGTKSLTREKPGPGAGNPRVPVTSTCHTCDIFNRGRRTTTTTSRDQVQVLVSAQGKYTIFYAILLTLSTVSMNRQRPTTDDGLVWTLDSTTGRQPSLGLSNDVHLLTDDATSNDAHLEPNDAHGCPPPHQR
jgi:hypothetical protein